MEVIFLSITTEMIVDAHLLTRLRVWLCVYQHQGRHNTARVNGFSAGLGQRVEDPIHFGQRYESLIRLMNAIAHLF